jgi:hypothetical protein
MSIWKVVLFVVLAAAALLAACKDDGKGGSEVDEQAVIDVVTKLASTNGATATQADIDYYMSHVTDGFVTEFGTESVEACRANAAECIGDALTNPTIDPATVEVDGDSATAIIAAEEGSFGVNFVKQNDVWLGDGLFVPNDEVPEGTEVVDLSLTEFAFAGDLQSDAVTSGNFAFHVTNDGEQLHEVVLVPLPADRPLQEILQDETFEPEPIFVKFAYGPGEESDVALSAPLDPGRYGLVCFLPDTDDPEMTPHAFKGMVSEFTVE